MHHRYAVSREVPPEKIISAVEACGLGCISIETVPGETRFVFDREPTKEECAKALEIVSNFNAVPEKITPRQVRLALIGAGYSLDQIDAFLNSFDEPMKSIARVWWEYSTEFQRSNPVMNDLAPGMGISQDELDELFRVGSTL